MMQQAQPGDAIVAPASLSASVVSKEFGAVVALNQVSLELRPGEIHGLIGPNGSGKTTLLNLLSGYYQPTAGAIQLRGEELAQASVRRRAQLGVARTFQNRACSARSACWTMLFWGHGPMLNLDFWRPLWVCPK